MKASIVANAENTAPASQGHGFNITFRGYPTLPSAMTHQDRWRVSTLEKDVDLLLEKQKKQFEDISFLTLLMSKAFSYVSDVELIRQHSAWRDMFRFNSGAVTTLALTTARCWLTYNLNSADTGELGKVLYTSLSNSTTEHEAYNLLLDQLNDSQQQDTLTSRFSRYNKANWDGYGAAPITPETIRAARRFLRMLPSVFGEPEMAPGSDGIIAMEWLFEDEHPLRKLFIDVGPGNVWSVYFRRADGKKGTMPEEPITADTKIKLEALFAQLSK
jgi:hypothetical protein